MKKTEWREERHGKLKTEYEKAHKNKAPYMHSRGGTGSGK
jgi:hypothetical protein